MATIKITNDQKSESTWNHRFSPTAYLTNISDIKCI